MKQVFWIAALTFATGLGFWMVFGKWFPTNNFVLALVCGFFAIQPIGGFWMVYQSIRYEDNVGKFVLLAMVPYFWLWYYFNRVRPMRLAGDRHRPEHTLQR